MIFLKQNLLNKTIVTFYRENTEHDVLIHYLIDGYAFGEILEKDKDKGKSVLISYPKYDDLVPSDIHDIVEYFGNDRIKEGISLEDICIRYGVIKEILN